MAELVHEESKWLAQQAVNNRMPPLRDLFIPANIAAYRERIARQKAHAGRISTAALIYAYALEPSDPKTAADVRRAARGWGAVANFIGDETAIDYLSDQRFERFRQNLRRISTSVLELKHSLVPPEDFRAATKTLFDQFF